MRTTKRSISYALLTVFVVTIMALTGASDVFALGHGEDPNRIPGNTLGCDVCHDFTDGVGYYDTPSLGNLRWIRSSIEWPPGSGIYHTVNYTSTTGPNSLADGDSTYDGPCEVCHTSTLHHRSDGSDGTEHYDGDYCISCHPHFLDDITNYFEIRFVGGQSHETHIADYNDIKGPGLEDCTDCHTGPPDFSTFGPSPGVPFEDTDVCDNCHSPGGVYDGVGEYDPLDTPEDDTWELAHPDSVAYGAKYNWEDGIYNDDRVTLKGGKKDWCATCHDNQPGSSNADGTGVMAPNVMGDAGQTYGYKISGHGKYSAGEVTITCEDCHELALLHIDRNARTYDASTYPNSNYVNGYRLNDNIIIPRTTQLPALSFRLCFDSCHIYSDVFSDGVNTNFRKDSLGEGLHRLHLEGSTSFASWDSDWNNSIDSTMSCPACHNMHGSPTPAMIRHGELISTPGTTDKVPALDFMWYMQDRVTPTTVLELSRYGSLKNPGGTGDLSKNHVCSYCHSWTTGSPRGALGEYIDYYRTSGGAVTVTINNVKTTDLSNNYKTTFYPGENIRYHVAFTVTGSSSFFLKAGDISKAESTSGTAWETLLKQNDTLSAGDYSWKWTTTVPPSATIGSGAKVTLRLNMFDAPGGTLISKSNIFTRNFSIVAP